MICRVFLATCFALLLPLTAINAQSDSGPEAGTVVDDFSLQDQNGTSHTLGELLEDGPIALVVFRSADW